MILLWEWGVGWGFSRSKDKVVVVVIKLRKGKSGLKSCVQNNLKILKTYFLSKRVANLLAPIKNI